MQSGSETQSERREQASQLLYKVAQKFHNPRLSTLAYHVKLDAFTCVKKVIDDMIAQLLKQATVQGVA